MSKYLNETYAPLIQEYMQKYNGSSQDQQTVLEAEFICELESIRAKPYIVAGRDPNTW